MLLNVNIPAVVSEISGVVLTGRGVRRYIDVLKSADPRGKTYYWLAGELLGCRTGQGLNLPQDIPTDAGNSQQLYYCDLAI